MPVFRKSAMDIFELKNCDGFKQILVLIKNIEEGPIPSSGGEGREATGTQDNRNTHVHLWAAHPHHHRLLGPMMFIMASGEPKQGIYDQISTGNCMRLQ